jgi:hypothetical protein
MDEPEFVNPDEFDDWDDVDSTTVDTAPDDYVAPAIESDGC